MLIFAFFVKCVCVVCVVHCVMRSGTCFVFLLFCVLLLFFGVFECVDYELLWCCLCVYSLNVLVRLVCGVLCDVVGVVCAVVLLCVWFFCLICLCVCLWLTAKVHDLCDVCVRRLCDCLCVVWLRCFCAWCKNDRVMLYYP